MDHAPLGTLLSDWASAAAAQSASNVCSEPAALLGNPYMGVSGILHWAGSTVSQQVVKISLLDVWAGVSSFAEGFSSQEHVTVSEHAWIENAPAALAVLKAFHKAAQYCTDFYDRTWRDWSFNHRLVVVAGPSCCPFSVSGKRQRQHDPRSTQGLETAALAVALGALVLIMENVVNLVDENPLHHILDELNEYLAEHRMVAVSCWRLADAAMGGATGRVRVFLRWETEEMASCLPPVSEQPKELQPARVRDFLDSVGSSSQLAVEGQSVFEPSDDAPGRQEQGSATQIGRIWLRGPEEEWMLGEALKLRGDDRVWRVLDMTDTGIKLLFDSRRAPKFKWLSRSKISLTQRHWISWPVYSIEGIAKAIRHANFAPGDLFLDTRGDSNLVRPLSGAEKWRLTGLSDAKAQHLVSAGLGDQLGPLAGNSIPVRMTEALAASESARVLRFETLLQKRAAGEFTLMPPVPALCSRELAATFLIVLGLKAEEVVCWDGGQIPGMVHSVNQQQAFDQACGWAESLSCKEAKSRCLLLEQPMGNSRARTIIWYDAKAPQIEGARVIRIADVMGHSVGELAVAALTQVQRMVGVTLVNPSALSGWESGRVPGTAAFQTEVHTAPSPAESAAFKAERDWEHQKIAEIKRKLDADKATDMEAWSERLVATDYSELPSNLRSVLPKLSWSGVVIRDPHKPVKTAWQPLPQPKGLSKRPASQGWLSAVLREHRPEAYNLVKAFKKKMTRWLAGTSERPNAVVIPGSWLEHWVFEAPHEFHSDPGWAVPMDESRPSESHLNLAFFASEGEQHPDQELISFLMLGVRYKADLPVQIVLLPHLNSFLPAQEKYLQEADRFVERGWTVLCSEIPTVPFFSCSCGSVCRPMEPGRPRCTNDAGAPRKPLWDADGLRVIPLNEAISCSEWPKQVMPGALDVVTAMRVLKEAAQILGEAVFVVTDDYKSFFNQLRLSVSEYCKTGAVHPPRPGQEGVTFAYDTVLGFGVKMASNIAQRFADLLVIIFRRKLAPFMQALAARKCAVSAEFTQWWEHREQLGDSQAVLFSMFMYCDDPCIMSVGADMTHEVLKVWTWLARSSNTMMAICEKRSFGLSAQWIGVRFFTSLGAAVVTAQKVMRASVQMGLASSSSLNYDQYRSLIGFLEHVRETLFLRGDKMYGLYEPLSRDLDPIELVQANSLMQKQLTRFKRRLAVQAGSSVSDLPAFLSGRPMPRVSETLSVRRLALFSDAAKEGTAHPGLGGWICGYTWRVPLTAEHLELDIPVLEAVAAVVNVLCAHRIVGGTDHLPADVCFEVHVDAQATAQVLIKGRARAPMMQHVHKLALQYREFVEMLPFLLVLHIFGLGNVASDAASRGYSTVLQIVADSLGVRLTHVEPPGAALLMLASCVKKNAKLKHEFRWGERGKRVGEAENPGPTFVPMRGKVMTHQPDAPQAPCTKRTAHPLGHESQAPSAKRTAAPAASFQPMASRGRREQMFSTPPLNPPAHYSSHKACSQG